MIPELPTEKITSPITGPSSLAPGLLRSFCAVQCRVCLLSPLCDSISEWDRAIRHLSVVSSAVDFPDAVA